MNFAKNLVCFAAFLFAPITYAQQITGSIRGTVTDYSGAIVEGASVSAKQSETSLTPCDDHGSRWCYVLLDLPVGHYQLQIERSGFQTYLQQGITLNVNEAAAISVSLKVGTATDKVEVNADADLIDATITSLGTVVTEQRTPRSTRSMAAILLSLVSSSPASFRSPLVLAEAGGPCAPARLTPSTVSAPSPTIS